MVTGPNENRGGNVWSILAPVTMLNFDWLGSETDHLYIPSRGALSGGGNNQPQPTSPSSREPIIQQLANTN